MSKFTRNQKPVPTEGESVEEQTASRGPGEPETGEQSSSPPGQPAGAPPEAAGAAPAPTPAEYEALVKRAEERDLYRNELLRSRADFDNYQKRVNRERPQIQEQAVRRLVADLLPVLDNFDRALGGEEGSLDSLKSGIRIVRQLLARAFTDHGIEEIEALEKPFDPLLHEAVIHEESTAYPPGTVSEVLQKGYTHRGGVVRAAQVKVARAPGSASGDTPSGGKNH